MNAKNIVRYRDILPEIGKDVFIADNARIIGEVLVGDCTSVWYNAVIRGDINKISVGAYSNIQDNSTLHVADEFSCKVGSFVTVGHGAILHGCTIADNCLIGMGTIILNGAEIGENCIVGAGTLIPERKVIPANSLVIGSPGKVVRTVEKDEIQAIRASALKYSAVAKSYNTD